MSIMRPLLSALLVLLCVTTSVLGEPNKALDVGVAGHAFDHLGAIGDQAQAAAASGANIIYATGFGGIGYTGLPGPAKLKEEHERIAAYTRQAKAAGIRLAIGYICATSIVKLETFDRQWTPEFRSHFSSPPVNWLQVGPDGKPLPSWYGGDYRPACMSHPDWRTYQKSFVRRQLETGHDGVFFDNPTVHPQGCYCEHCMKGFAAFLANQGVKLDSSLTALRKEAASRPKDFMRFRCTIARDFLAEMRQYARTINPNAMVTCNNSLNSPDAFFSQSRGMAYNIYEMSKAEDWVVVEDMATLTRIQADGSIVEYGPVYEMLHAISHGKPVVAVTLAEADYHTAPNLSRLAMAEAAAHGASWLSWPAWPQNVRPKMTAPIRPQADLLRENAALLNGARRRADVVLFLPFRRWLETAECQPLKTARALCAANVQFRIVCEDDLAQALADHRPNALVVESPDVLPPDETRAVEQYEKAGGRIVWSQRQQWPTDLEPILRRSIVLKSAPPTVRAMVHDRPGQTIVHLLNLNVQRVSSFEDKVTPATNVRLIVNVPFAPVRSVKAISADTDSTRGEVTFTVNSAGDGTSVEFTLPKLDISTMLSIQ
jgi:hypothetical protein